MTAKMPAAFGSENVPSRNRHQREAVEDQRGGVVGQPLALEDDEDPARHAELAGDRQRRHHVRRRDDGAEQEADIPRQPDQIMRGGGHREGGEDHAADRQQDDGAQIVLEFAPAHGDAGRIDQRRQHHQQHQFRRQFQRRHARHEGERDPAQQQQDGRRDVGPPRQQRGARQHRQQDEKNLKLGFHEQSFGSSIRPEAGRGQCGHGRGLTGRNLVRLQGRDWHIHDRRAPTLAEPVPPRSVRVVTKR